MSLRRYVIRRVLVTVPVLFGVSVLTFSMVALLPGSSVDYLLGFQPASAELRAALGAQYHLDEPVWKQYLYWLRDAVRLDFGRSMISGRDVTGALVRRLPDTVVLGLLAWGIAVAVGVPAGIVAAVREGELADDASRVGALVGIATPNFWLGLLLLLLFGVHLGWVRVIPPTDVPLWSPRMLGFALLPAVTLGTASAALLMRLMRSSMVEELRKGYVRAARAKGLPERTIIVRLVARNSLTSVVTVAALQLALLVDGAVVVEQVFSWPGVGRLLVESIRRRDVAVIQATVLVVATVVVLANLVADVLYAWLDPRIRY